MAAAEPPAHLDAKGKSVAILAMGPSLGSYFAEFRNYASRNTDLVWAINNAGYWIHDIDMLISMDDLQRDGTHWPHYIKNLESRGKPIMTCTAYEKYPLSVAYPIDEVIAFLGRPNNLKPFWLDNSINYAIALALYHGARRIELYGCDFQHADNMDSNEMADRMDSFPEGFPGWAVYHQRDTVRNRRSHEPGCEATAFLIGFARARGVQVYIPQGSTLMDMDRPHYLYGYQEQPYDDDGQLQLIAEAQDREVAAQDREVAAREADRLQHERLDALLVRLKSAAKNMRGKDGDEAV